MFCEVICVCSQAKSMVTSENSFYTLCPILNIPLNIAVEQNILQKFSLPDSV